MAPLNRKPSSQKADQGASRAWQAITPSLSEWILDAVSSMGFDRMTPVQASTIPLFTGNKDVVVEAVTGSGKTLAFLIPIVQRLLRLEEPIRKHHIGAVVISPTRELATQIHSVLLSLLAFHAPSAVHLNSSPNLNSDSQDEASKPPPPEIYSSSTLRIIPQLLVGGTTPPSQDLAHFLTNSPNLLISTPGRLLELLSSPHVHCPQSSFEVLVLDEADRLLDLGFKDDLQRILQRLPKQRRTGLFSASVSEAVDQLVRVGLRNPVRIAVKVKGKDGVVDQRTPASLKMTYLTTPPPLKLPYLLSLVAHLEQPPQKTIVYLSTCAAVDYFSHVLRNLLPIIGKKPNEWSIIPLHGRQTAVHRNTNLAKFIDSAETSLLLTTDLASRGLDIPLVDLTVQLDPPSDPKTFLHRAGRAGRAGRRGLAIVFLTPGRESNEYPAFLAVRKTPVEPLADVLAALPHEPLASVSDAQAQAATAAIRTAVAADRALHDKAQRAFVSFVRSYAAHAARSIFRVGELDWPALAEAWGLLRLPKMPELKQAARAAAAAGGDSEAINLSLGLTVDWENFAYRDKQREAKRRREMLASPPDGKQTKGQPGKGKSSTGGGTAWSAKVAVQETAAARRAKKAAKRTAVRRQGLSEEDRRRESELEGMIARVRQGNSHVDEFDGFSD